MSIVSVEPSPLSTGRFKGLLISLQRYHVPILLALTIVTRVGVFFHLDTVTLGWRQADMSRITMNYLRNGFRFLYPQVDWGGAGPGYVEMEFPLVPYLTALLYKMFGVHEVWALLIPFLCGISIVVVIYSLVKRMYDPAVALMAGLFTASSPLLSLASQTFLVEPPLLLSVVASVFFLVRWVDEDRTQDFLLSALFTTLAVLLKLTMLYIGLPLLLLFIVKYRSGTLRQLRFWLFGVLTLLPPFLWYFHAHSLYLEYGNTFGILAGGYNKFARAELLLSPDFYILMAKRIVLS
ncbi:MAG: glycosyltransferase family 39 protein, partial [Bacteroidota bacterium]